MRRRALPNCRRYRVVKCVCGCKHFRTDTKMIWQCDCADYAECGCCFQCALVDELIQRWKKVVMDARKKFDRMTSEC